MKECSLCFLWIVQKYKKGCEICVTKSSTRLVQMLSKNCGILSKSAQTWSKSIRNWHKYVEKQSQMGKSKTIKTQ